MRADDGAAATDDPEAGFEDRPRSAAGDTGTPELRLGAWEGPLDLLLELARAQKVDLSRLSILDLAGQFGAALEAAAARRRVPLARLGDWLVMAAHLMLLRSRLLLPADSAEAVEARREAEALRRRFADREFVRRLADWLERRPRLGRDVFARGRAAEGFEAREQAAPQADIVALLRACLAVLEKGHDSGSYRPAPRPLWRVPDALARLRRMLPAAAPEGAALERFLPELEDDGGPDARCGAGRRWSARSWPGWRWAARGASLWNRKRPSAVSACRRRNSPPRSKPRDGQGFLRPRRPIILVVWTGGSAEWNPVVGPRRPCVRLAQGPHLS